MRVKGDAADDIPVDLEDVVVLELREDFGARAPDELFVFDGLADEGHDPADVAFLSAADLLVVVGVNHRPDPLIAENLPEQRIVPVAVQQMHPGNAFAARARGPVEFERQISRECRAPFLQHLLRLGNRELPHQLALVLERTGLAKKEDLRCLQGERHLYRHRVGIHPVGPAIAIEAERGQHWDDSLLEQKLEALGIDALDPSGELLVHAPDDPLRVGGYRVDVSGAQIHAGESLEDLMGQPGGCI